MRFDFERFRPDLFDFKRLNLRFDAAALGQALAAARATVPGKAAAAGGALLASSTIVYAIWPASAPQAPVDAVVTAQAPVFTPVAWKAATAAPSAAAPDPGAIDPGAGDEAAPLPGDTLGLVRAVQRELKRAGCYRGRIDGRWNAATRNAMGAFTEVVNARLPVDVADPVLLVLLETHQDATCGQAASSSKPRLASIAPETASVPEASAARPERKVEREPDPVETGASGSEAQRDAEVAAAEPDGDPVAEERIAEQPGASATAAAALASAAAVSTQKVASADRPYVKRKYRKKNSFSRTVSRNFRKLQRGLRFFW